MAACPYCVIVDRSIIRGEPPLPVAPPAKPSHAAEAGSVVTSRVRTEKAAMKAALSLYLIFIG